MERATPTRIIYATTIVVALVWIVLDQATKIAAVRQLENQPANDLGPVILRVIRNAGGAFSLPLEIPWLFVVVAVLVTFLVARALPETTSAGLAAAYGLVVGGAIGNGADRIFRDGAVVDMIDLNFPPLRDFPVFNVADIGITVGALLVALLMVLADRSREQGSEPAVLHDTGSEAVDPGPPAEADDARQGEEAGPSTDQPVAPAPPAQGD